MFEVHTPSIHHTLLEGHYSCLEPGLAREKGQWVAATGVPVTLHARGGRQTVADPGPVLVLI